MTQEDAAKAVVMQYVEAFNQGNMNKLREILADDAQIQGVFGQGIFDKIAPIWRQLIEGYGMQLEVQSMVAEGNTVAVRYLESGTFRAAAFGQQPTGKSYQLVAMEWFEIEAGKIKSRWGARDSASQAKQLGI
ncbi:nuclear transport factor 2 family protein [Halioxenophilus sp. WMMB6]|uniref:ester cyclase n=1 Tax=Halioxenophilus sp. WMMB6 TaxID=3073815 RepID=UPI00295E7F45|nr:nuclear transport factor 2 family protein [Halioxenophilus sp. WMMB6]